MNYILILQSTKPLEHKKGHCGRKNSGLLVLLACISPMLFRNLIDKVVLEQSSSCLRIYDGMSNSVGFLIGESFYFTIISCL
jgi:hypothetical protein